MKTHHRISILLWAALLWAAPLLVTGCGGGRNAESGGSSSGNVPVSVLVTDAPAQGISVLSFQATIAAAQLNPGNVPLITTPTTVELTRLQTDSSLITPAPINVPPGNYTSVALTLTNASITFQNNTGAALTVGGSACANTAICSANPTIIDMSGSATFPNSGISLAANTPAALLFDLQLANLLTSPGSPPTIAVDVTAANAFTVAELASQQASPVAMLEDVVGVVAAPVTANGVSSFTLQTALGNYNVVAGTGTSPTSFSNFTSGSSANFACLAANQIVSVDIALRPDGTLLATRVLFEDAATTEPEIEGMVVATTGLTPPAQFRLVVLQQTPPGSVSAMPVGSVVLVNPQQATFETENLVGAAATSAYVYSFQGIQDVIVGQELQIQRLSTSTNTQIDAARIRLRSSRITANVATVGGANGFSDIFLGNGTLPAMFLNAGISQIEAIASPAPQPNAFTEFAGNATNITQIAIGNLVSVRGQLFANGATPALVATKVVKH